MLWGGSDKASFGNRDVIGAGFSHFHVVGFGAGQRDINLLCFGTSLGDFCMIGFGAGDRDINLRCFGTSLGDFGMVGFGAGLGDLDVIGCGTCFSDLGIIGACFGDLGIIGAGDCDCDINLGSFTILFFAAFDDGARDDRRGKEDGCKNRETHLA